MPPTVLIDSLHNVRRKVKVLTIAFGAGIVLACAVGVIVATVFLDWVFDLSAFPRLVFILASLVGIGWAAAHWIVKPALAKLSLSDVAGRLENAFPSFGDRLRSTIAFTQPNIPGSEVMKDRVATEASQMAQSLDLTSALVVKPVMMSVAGGLGALFVMILLGILVGREYLNPAISRLLNPFSDMPWPKRVQISASALPPRVPVGAKVNIAMKLTKGDKASAKAIVHYQYDNGPEQMINMSRSPDGSFLASLDAKGGALKVWMKSGDDETRPASITVVPRLAIQNVALVVAPPKYAALDPFSVDLSTKPAMITYGSDATLRVAFNKPLDITKPVALEPVRTDLMMPKLAWDIADASHPSAKWNARESIRFRIRATDTDGFTNTALEEYEILVAPDQMPRVAIERPTEKVSMTPDATLRMQIRAEDDFDIKTMRLIVDRTQRADKATTQPTGNHWEIDLASWQKIDRMSEFQPFRLQYNWELPKLADAKLTPGDTLQYYVEVRDNFELDGQIHPPVYSRKLELAVISQKDLENKVIDALRQVSEEVAHVQNAQKNTKEATRQLQQDTKDKPEFNKAEHETAERRINDQSTLSSQTRTVSQRVEQLQEALADNKSPNQELKDLTNDVKDALNRAAEKPMKDATDKLGEANRQQADPKASKQDQQKQTDQRNEAMTQAQENQQKAADQLQQALDRMKNIGTLQKAIESISKILEKQQAISGETAKIGKENLGKKPEEMSKEAREQQDKNAKEQSDLSKETQKATDDLQKMAEQMQKSDQAAAEAMKQAAQTSQQQAVPQKQQQASEQEQQNQQSQAQNNQKQAELGLQMMLDTLREAERRKLEKLAKQLDDAMKAVENLVRQQAGHNIDNLMNQGGDKVKLVTKDLLAKAKRVEGHLPPLPPPPALTGLQEQTERNTSDVLKSLGDLPGGAEASANLNRASTKMGYAIVSLRDKKLAEAYDPHQTEALAALEAALAKLQEQKQQVQAKLDQQKKEKIREAYIKIRDEQVKVNDRTVKVDTAKQPDGALPHAAQVDLNKLPGEQGKLADRIKKIGEDLAGISVVYQWANTDIFKSMGEVKDDLAKPETGKPTQIEQARVVEQLNAMIENLAIKPPDPSKFEKQAGGGGGGGGGGKKPLPSEAELRLLKDLQIAINKGTTKIADLVGKQGNQAKQQDKQKLVALGGRQGELRDLLDKVLKQASQGQSGLPAKPASGDQLPEEVGEEKIEDQELEKNLLEDKPIEEKSKKDINLIGDRMARSQERLQDNQDPGKTTQKIQERIIRNMDDLIAMARQQQQQQQGQPGKGEPQEGPPKPGEGDAQAQNQGQQPGKSQPNKGQTAATDDNATAANENDAQFGNVKETAEQWGQVSPRLKDAVLEGATEKVPEKYRKLVQDYYRSLATKATERK